MYIYLKVLFTNGIMDPSKNFNKLQVDTKNSAKFDSPTRRPLENQTREKFLWNETRNNRT